ncbi:MAG TPA: hypothetical protein VJU61_11960, partial [Polyangiaceae bacterium]|nr:hypothetical protein [Polyangiaceae bacterium]
MTPEDVRRERLRQEKEWYLSEAGFLDFIRDCGAAPDAQQQPHGRYCQDLITWRGEPDPEAPERILYKYKLVLWPRGTFKTAAFDVGHICWLIAGNADLRIFVGSETETLSTQIVEQVMKIIDSQWFRDRFGIHKGKQWKLGDSFTSAQRSLNALKYKEPTLQALSVGVVTTGFHWDYGFMDDIHSQKNTANPEQIEKVWVWFGDMMAQLDPGSRLFMMATLHHYADTYCRIMKDPKLAALFEISVHAWSSPIIDPNSSDEADLFFPGRLTRRYVAEQKAKLTPRQYACYYENRPFSGDQQLFKPKYFQVIGDQHIPTAVWTYILTDFAFMAEEKKKGKPDRTAFWVISIDTNLVAYVRDFYVGMVRLNDSCRTLCELWNNWQHVHLKGVTIEGGVCFQTVRSMLEEIRRQTFIMPRLIEVGGRNQIEKEQRIESTEPRFRRGDIYFAQSLRQEFKEKWGPMIDEMT